MDLTNFSLDELQFSLAKKQHELQSLDVTTFTFNPDFVELAKEIIASGKATETLQKFIEVSNR